MDFIIIILIMAVTFGVCFLIDKGFHKLFRNKPQHMSGQAVRVNKRLTAAGVILIVLGIAAIFAGGTKIWYLTAGGALIEVVGIALVVYYLTFGIYYDDKSFVLTRFGRKSITYQFGDITGQRLYTGYGNVMVDLQMKDGSDFQIQSSMSGVYPFMDTAFNGWLQQTGRKKEDCDFYDPDNSCWFPVSEDK